MKKILIFGATGTIGAYTAIQLSERFEVIAIGRRKSDNGFFSKHGIKYYSVDITKKDAFSVIEENNISTVIHLAGIMPAAMNGYRPHDFVDSVIHGTLNVLEFCVKKEADKIIFSQSRADSNYLMGKTPIPSDIVRKFPLTGDHSVYSICKNAAVDLIEYYFSQYGLKRFIFRLPTIYAYHPNPYFYVNGVKKYMAYRYIIDKAVKGEDIEVWGDPSKAKEMVYIKDAVQAIHKAILSPLDGGVYNIGRGIGVSLDEQIKSIVKVFSPKDKPSKLIYCSDKPDAREYVNDISKTEKELGYIPQFNAVALYEDYKKYYENEPFAQLWGTKNDYI